jgi:hypothetical protein
MSLSKKALFAAIFIATTIALPCFARASRFTPFLDKKEHTQEGQRNMRLFTFDFKKSLFKAYHAVNAFYFSKAAQRYEKKSNACGMRAAWIGIGLGSESELAKQNSHRVTSSDMDKPFFFTLPFIKAWGVKNKLFNSIANHYRTRATKNYTHAKKAMRMAEYHQAQLAALNKKTS